MAAGIDVADRKKRRVRYFLPGVPPSWDFFRVDLPGGRFGILSTKKKNAVKKVRELSETYPSVKFEVVR